MVTDGLDDRLFQVLDAVDRAVEMELVRYAATASSARINLRPAWQINQFGATFTD